MLFKKCKTCNEEYLKPQRQSFIWWKKSCYCSLSCARKAPKTEIWYKRITEINRGKKYALGYKHTEEQKINLSIKGKGNKNALGFKWTKKQLNNKPVFLGELSPKWIKDRTKIKIGDRSLNDPLQKQWRKEVKNRDKWVCRIADNNCAGRLEAHHILPWSKFPELRYQINNGITLCHAHHPIKNDDVAKLSPFFQKLVAEMN